MLMLSVVNLVHAYALVREASGVCVASRRAAAAPRGCLSMGTTSIDDSLLPVVALSTGDSTAEVHLFGGCVTSYSKGGIEQLAHRLDSRLDGERQYYCWGLSAKHIVKTKHNKGSYLSRLERLRYLAFAQPTCLDLPSAAEHGQYFYQIDESWLDSANEKHGWTQPLTEILKTRMDSMIAADNHGLITGSRTVDQPSGRYMNPADYIRRWNATCCKCKCGIDTYLGWETDWVENVREEEPWVHQRATVQRIDPAVMHLESNCAPRLMCHSCNSTANWNPIINDVRGRPLLHEDEAE